MTGNTQSGGGMHRVPWRILGWGTAAFLLLLPLVANAPWTLSDFVFMGVLLGLVGLAFELIVRKSAKLAYRVGAAGAVVTALLTIWVNAAVGMIGDGPYNLLFGGVLVVALGGAILARFDPAGMARAMVAAAVVQGMLSTIGLSSDFRGAVLSMCFVVPWLLAAAFFRNAAREKAPAGAAR